MFLRGEVIKSLKAFASGKRQPSYLKQRTGDIVKTATAVGGTTLATMGFKKESRRKKETKLTVKRKLQTGLGVSALGSSAILGDIAKVKGMKLPAGDPKRIAILHSPGEFGAGHEAAAKALATKFQAAGYNTKLFNSKDYQNWLGKTVFYGGKNPASYTSSVQRNPAFYFKGTFASTKPGPLVKIRNLIAGTSQEAIAVISGESKNTAKALKAYRPGRLVSTYFGSLPPLRNLNKTVDLIATDYEISPALWKSQNAGTYFVPGEASKKALIAANVSKDRIVNIKEVPVTDQIIKKIKKTTGRKIPKNVVVMGGGLGLRTHEVGPIVEKVYKDLGLKRNVTILPGRKGTLAREALKKTKLLKNTKVLAAGKDHYRYLRDADIVITRPGGATTGELRALGKPVITFNESFSSQASHEGGNVRSILRSGQGEHATLTRKIDPSSKSNYQTLKTKILKVEKNYKKMKQVATKKSIRALQNQVKIVPTIIKIPVRANKSLSLLSKTIRTTAGATAVLGSLYAYKQLKKLKN